LEEVHVHGFVKICELDDVPPGKGKIVRVGRCEVYVYNREGRIFATVPERAVAGAAHARESPPGEAPPACHHPGSRFEVEQEDSPARVRAHAAGVLLRIDGEGVYVALDEGGGPVASALAPY
jgi:nitrite reductase/ring-hydroxylating ferredoxin subunit